MKYYLTSESVTEGHPDKICDKISDYILDEALRQDKNSKMAVAKKCAKKLHRFEGQIRYHNTREVATHKIRNTVTQGEGYDRQTRQWNEEKHSGCIR